jgi:ubiquinone/menaquinone biosynthesis C-methylase UbiE
MGCPANRHAPTVTDTGSEGTRQVQALFDVVADDYDSVGVPFFVPIATSMLTAMPPRRGERWLDVGCGRGAVLLPVARGVQPGGVVVGTDISSRMLDQCRRSVREQGLDGVELVLDDAQDPSVAGGPYDTLSSCLVLFFLPDPAAALRAWLPLVAPGGRLGVTTFSKADPRWAALTEMFTPYLPQDERGSRSTKPQGPFASDEGMENLVTAAGWTQVHTVHATVEVRFETPAQWEAFSMATGQRAMWMSVPKAERDRVRQQAYRLLAQDADPDGTVTYWQQVRHTLGRR